MQEIPEWSTGGRIPTEEHLSQCHSVHVPKSWNQTRDLTVREAAVNSVEGEPMNSVCDFLLPDIVLLPIVSILSYAQLDKSNLKIIYDNSERQRKPAFAREKTTKEVTYCWHRRLDTLCRLIITHGVVSRTFYSSANTWNLISERNRSSISYRLQLDQEFVVIYKPLLWTQCEDGIKYETAETSPCKNTTILSIVLLL